jgi:catechol 2,3-dioxygenase-like lactoylglutathione lyase family enzyme
MRSHDYECDSVRKPWEKAKARGKRALGTSRSTRIKKTGGNVMENTKKIHLALNVNDVERSVKFYRAMFGTDPVKWKPGYAKFDIAEPPVNLTLNQGGEVTSKGALNHLGIEVKDTSQVLAAKKRFAQAGLVTADEMNVDCCFALQDKVWITDPDGNRWEVFTVKIGDTKPELNVTDNKTNPAQPPGCCQATTC